MSKIFVLVLSIFVLMSLFGAGAKAQQSVWGDLMPCVSGDYRPCGIDEGECKKGVRECENGEWGECKGNVGPVNEICGNEKDDDCNGIVDDCIDDTFALISIGVGVAILVFAFILSRVKVHEKEDEF